MDAVASLIRRAQPHDGLAVVDGEPLTSQRLRRILLLTFLEHDATADELIASHGPQTALGHEMGSGVIRAGEAIVVDIWPRDTASACFTDMTRTFVVGDPPTELLDWHRIVKNALDAALAEIRPGVSGRTVYDRACEDIEAAGHATRRTKELGKPLDHGFYHALGHAVGLDVHESPMLAGSSWEELVAGDVLAVEPGIYRPDFGGCRLEDVVLVTENGAVTLTDYPYDLSQS